jgi:hypothetical protein
LAGDFKVNTRKLICVALIASFASPALAGNLRYRPTNPAFGGNPNVTGFLLGTSQIQNQHTGSSSGGDGGGAPDISFPPIVIDLGGVGDDPVDDTAGDVAATQP